MVFHSKSALETQTFAQNLALKFKKTGGILALYGDLGAGKTTFAQGFAKGLGIKEKVISPTFVLIRHHKIPASPAKRGEPTTKRVFYHIDLYRLESDSDIKNAGIGEILDDTYNDVVLIEWAEKLHSLPPSVIKINLEKISETQRKISVI